MSGLMPIEAQKLIGTTGKNKQNWCDFDRISLAMSLANRVLLESISPWQHAPDFYRFGLAVFSSHILLHGLRTSRYREDVAF
jgi:hypothetical protein